MAMNLQDVYSNEEKVLKVREFMNRVGGRFNLSFETTTRMRLVPTELYVNSPIAVGGTASLLTSETKRQAGISNFDGDKLQAGRFFIADGITILYGKKESDKEIYQTSFSDTLPEVLKASEFVLRQNGEVVISLPVASIVAAQKTKEYYRLLDAFAIIEPMSTIEMSIITPNGSTFESTETSGGAKPYVRVLIKGFETILKR